MHNSRLILTTSRLSFSKNSCRKLSSENNLVKNVAGLSPQTASSDYKNKAMLVLNDSKSVSYEQMNILSGRIAQCLNTKYGIFVKNFLQKKLF